MAKVGAMSLKRLAAYAFVTMETLYIIAFAISFFIGIVAVLFVR